jgi:endoglucanase
MIRYIKIALGMLAGAGILGTVAISAPEIQQRWQGRPVSPEVQHAVGLLGRGINLGAALESPKEGSWQPALESSDFDAVATAGFDSIRLPIRWSINAMEEPPYSIDRAMFERVDWAIEQALSRSLSIIINVHHYRELMTDPEGHRERFLALWNQIATYYADQPDHVLFEVLNEPNQAMEFAWNRILEDTLAVIRKSNPDRVVIIGGTRNNSIGALDKLEVPDDPRLIATVHYYMPLEFTLQGADWVDNAENWLGTTWNGTAEDQLAVKRDFDRASAWSARQGIPIYLGEFGTYDTADQPSRLRWTRFVREEAERQGWAWAYWNLRSGFGAYDYGTKSWNDLLPTLISDNLAD